MYPSVLHNATEVDVPRSVFGRACRVQSDHSFSPTANFSISHAMQNARKAELVGRPATFARSVVAVPAPPLVVHQPTAVRALIGRRRVGFAKEDEQFPFVN